MGTNHRSVRPVSLTLACLVLTACSVSSQPTSPSAETPFKAGGPTTAATAALAHGLAVADSFVTDRQFQVKTPAGLPIANAKVVVAGAVVTTDERGVVNLPDEVFTSLQNGTAVAQVSAPGYAGITAALLPGAALKLTPTDTLRTAVGPAGGLARNSEGNLELEVPPGALASDAHIAITRSYSADVTAGTLAPDGTLFTDHWTSGHDMSPKGKLLTALGEFRYNLDLGGGAWAPDQAFSVKFKVEGPMLTLIKNRVAAGDDLSTMTDLVSRDAQGNYWVTMRDFTPVSTAPKASGTPVTSGKYHVEATSCQTFYDETVADVGANGRAMTACEQFWDVGYRNYFLGAGYTLGVAGLMTHDANFNGGGCMYFDYDPSLYVCRDGGYQGGWWADRRDKIMRKWYTSTINAHVAYVSDDSRINGQAIPGATVYFNHATTPVHPAPTTVSTDGSGDASTFGLQNTGGYASASVPSQPYTYSSMPSYAVNCATVPVAIYKFLPKVQLKLTVGGSPTATTLAYPTNLGTATASTSNPTLAPKIDLATASVPFGVNGTVSPTADSQADLQSPTLPVGWNSSLSLATGLWWSKQVGVVLSYASNDASVSADMQPSTHWAGQAATGSSLSFSHAVSGATNKPANRDTLSFGNVASAATWGLNGASGTASATHSSQGVTLAGSAGYTVDGKLDKPLALNANLPELVLVLNGTGAGAVYGMDYVLTPAGGTPQTRHMALPAKSSDGKIHIWLPVEEPVGQAGKWSFKPTAISNGDYAVTMPDKSFNFPTVSGLARGTVTPYTTLGTEIVAPK